MAARRRVEESMSAPDGSAPARTAGARPAWSQAAVQELWYSLLKIPWASLVVVPVDKSCSAHDLIEALAEQALLHTARPMTTIDAAGKDATVVVELMASMMVEGATRDESGPKPKRVAPWEGRQILISIAPPAEDPRGIAVAFAADAVLLYVKAGQTRVRVAERTIALIGAERLIGCVFEK